MALTTIIAIAGVAISAASTVYSAVSSSNAQKQNAKVADYQATMAANAAKTKELQQRELDRRILASQRTKYAASGVTTEGSPLLVMMESQRQAELDAMRIRYGGEVEATGWRARSAYYDTLSRQSMASGMIGAGRTLLTGATDIYNQQQLMNLKNYTWGGTYQGF
jgi:hypothetical protein